MDLRENQEMACSIRECHQKTKEVFALAISLSTLFFLVSGSLLSPSLSMFGNGEATVGFGTLPYDLFIVVFFPSSPWVFAGEDRKLSSLTTKRYMWFAQFFTFLQSSVYFSPHFVPPPPLLLLLPVLSLFWESVWWLGRLFAATFVLEVRISGAPWSGGAEKQAGQRGWELNNGWFLTEIRWGGISLPGLTMLWIPLIFFVWPCLLGVTLSHTYFMLLVQPELLRGDFDLTEALNNIGP